MANGMLAMEEENASLSQKIDAWRAEQTTRVANPQVRDCWNSLQHQGTSIHQAPNRYINAPICDHCFK
eukprot:scaffold85853_cov38-Prasinocladus_malaysianus.AAC.1